MICLIINHSAALKCVTGELDTNYVVKYFLNIVYETVAADRKNIVGFISDCFFFVLSFLFKAKKAALTTPPPPPPVVPRLVKDVVPDERDDPEIILSTTTVSLSNTYVLFRFKGITMLENTFQQHLFGRIILVKVKGAV